MKKLFLILLGGILFFSFNFSAVEASNFSVSTLANTTPRKYTPPPARYAPPQVPDYGLPKPAYTPPPPPEQKK